MSHQSVGTPMSPTLCFAKRPISRGDLFRFSIEVLPKSERLHKVKSTKEMVLLPAEHSASGSQEECHGVIAMTMYCQLESVMLDASVVITPTRLPAERVIDCA